MKKKLTKSASTWSRHAEYGWKIFGHDSYITLKDEDDDECQELITAREILEHIEAKATDEPIDITTQLLLLQDLLL